MTDAEGAAARIVHPPATTMFEQLLDFLDRNPSPRPDNAFPRNGGEEWATVSLYLRWGSYFAVLADEAKPLSGEAWNEEISRVDEGEMARINIEASAALAAWVELRHADPERYARLLWAIRRWLPMRRWTIDTQPEYTQVSRVLYALGWPTTRSMLASLGSDQRRERREEAAQYPTRVFANAVINATWRNNCPIEDIHAGYEGGYSLRERRISLEEERKITSGVAGRMCGAFSALRLVDRKVERGDREAWVRFVTPYNLAALLLVTPLGWSLTEQTREVRLDGPEPAVLQEH